MGCGCGDDRSRSEDVCCSRALEEVIVSFGDHAAGDDQDVRSSKFFQGCDQFGNKRLMTSCQTGDANNVNIIFGSLQSHFIGCLEKRPDVNVETKIGKAGGSGPVYSPSFGVDPTSSPAHASPR